MNDDKIPNEADADAVEDMELDDDEAAKVTGGIENPTTIGSATSGAGAGKIKLNEA